VVSLYIYLTVLRCTTYKRYFKAFIVIMRCDYEVPRMILVQTYLILTAY